MFINISDWQFQFVKHLSLCVHSLLLCPCSVLLLCWVGCRRTSWTRF